MKNRKDSKVINLEEAKKVICHRGSTANRKRGLESLIKDYLERLEIKYEKLGEVFRIRSYMANCRLETIMYIDHGKRASFLGILTDDFLGVKLNPDQKKLRTEEVFRLVLRLNGVYRSLKFFLTDENFLEARSEIEISREMPSFERFRQLIFSFFYDLDQLYPKFVGTLFTEEDSRIDL